MPLASSGLRALPAPRTMGSMARSIHIPAFIPRPVPRPAGSFAQTVFKHTRTFLSRIVTQLATPGLSAPAAHIRSLHAGPGAARTIQQGLSFHARHALSRPLGAGPFLPRPPPVPRSIVQVGLGTARNFSTARPIFQNVVDNVPIATRAFWEADWDIKMAKERAAMRPKKYTKAKEQKLKLKLKKENERVRPAVAPAPVAPAPVAETAHAELDHYFPAPAVPDVTTYLLIPLAPTPTSRVPLPLSPPTHGSTHPLLPFSLLASVHTDHGTHALRVNTLFARLDASRVFDEPGVTCTALGGPQGMCTVLEVKFAGWTEARVRSVLGEAGSGWCAIEEVRENESQEMDEALSEMSFDTPSVASTPHGRTEMIAMDPATSFVLPTLDFSASFPIDNGSWSRTAPPAAPSSPLSDLEFHNAWTSLDRDLDSSSETFSDGSLSDSESDSDGIGGGWGDALTSSRRYSSGSSGAEGWVGLGFSSRFSGRLDEEAEGPREELF